MLKGKKNVQDCTRLFIGKDQKFQKKDGTSIGSGMVFAHVIPKK